MIGLNNKRENYIGRWLLLVLCFTSAPFITRILLICGRGKGFQVYDLAGFVSDLAISLAITLIFIFLSKGSRIASLLLIVLWCIFHYSNYEHAVINGDIVSLGYAKYLLSPTFLFGSALVVSNPLLIISILIVSLLIFFIKPVRITLIPLFALFVFIFTGISTRGIFASILNPRWRIYNVVQANIEDIFYSKFKKIDHSISVSTKNEYESLLNKDICGTPLVSVGNNKHNILLVVLEGVCGGVLPSARAHHRIYSEISMPKLDSIASENMVYNNFITLQRQTNRGMFSILSGSYPKLNSSTPKMTEFVTKKNLDNECTQEFLPKLLSKYGYETTYLQGSPLPYMLKDIFMKQAGFDYCYGTRWLKYSYSSNYWGVDDKAFFEQAFNLIASKNDASCPWFITLLTVGTHHPLNVPDNYGNMFEENKRQRAYSYLDDAISVFIDRLYKEGYLENTLVIITCDESQGIKDLKGDPPSKRLSQQWGILIVLHPYDKKIKINDKFTQFDIPISVMDYLNMPFDEVDFGGRSIFREYAENRDINFANTYGHITGCFTKENDLKICDENFNYGEQFNLKKDRLFSLNRDFIRKLTSDEISDIARFCYVSNCSITHIDNSVSRVFDFRSGKTHVISEGPQKTLLGGQFFTIPKNSAVTVKLRGRITSGDSSSLIFLKHDLAAKSGRVRIVKYMPKELTEGDVFHTTYSFYTTDDFYSVEFRVTCELRKGTPAKIILDEASLSYCIRKPTPEERKSHIHRYDKNVGCDLGAYIVVEEKDSLFADEKVNYLKESTTIKKGKLIIESTLKSP